MAYNTPQHASYWGNVILTGLSATPLLSDGITHHYDLEKTPGETLYLPVWSSFTVTQNTNCPTPDDEKTTSSTTATKYPITPEEYYIKIGFCQKDLFAMKKNMRDGLLERLKLDMILDFENTAGTALAAAISTNNWGDTASTITVEEFQSAKLFVQARSQGSEVICGCSTALFAALTSQKNIDMDPIMAGVTFIVSDKAFSNSANFIYPRNLFHYGRLGKGIFFKEGFDTDSGSDFTFIYHIYAVKCIDDIDDNGALLKTQDVAN